MDCVVCGHAGLETIYAGSSDVSITSLSKTINAKTTVHLCSSCGHLYTLSLIHI